MSKILETIDSLVSKKTRKITDSVIDFFLAVRDKKRKITDSIWTVFLSDVIVKSYVGVSPNKGEMVLLSLYELRQHARGIKTDMANYVIDTIQKRRDQRDAIREDIKEGDVKELVDDIMKYSKLILFQTVLPREYRNIEHLKDKIESIANREIATMKNCESVATQDEELLARRKKNRATYEDTLTTNIDLKITKETMDNDLVCFLFYENLLCIATREFKFEKISGETIREPNTNIYYIMKTCKYDDSEYITDYYEFHNPHGEGFGGMLYLKKNVTISIEYEQQYETDVKKIMQLLDDYGVKNVTISKCK